MFEWWKIIILGAVEGLTEFLPISSTGHLLIVAKWLDFHGSAGGTFEIFIQLGAILAVIGYYARDLLAQVQSVTHDRATQRFWLNLLVAFLPAALVGFVFRNKIKEVLYASPHVIAWAFIIGGIVLLIVELLPKRQVTTKDIFGFTLPQALSTGLFQILALVPGVSRSGATIVGGMLSGVDRAAATRFSFYLAIPVLVVATGYDLLKSLHQLSANDFSALALGLVVAMITAWFSIGWLLRYVANHTFIPFGIYRILAGLLILWLM
ncbi:MAG: undecaprenyl-diphosphate phosphatase [Caldilineaceae bacterium]